MFMFYLEHKKQISNLTNITNIMISFIFINELVMKFLKRSNVYIHIFYLCFAFYIYISLFKLYTEQLYLNNAYD